MPREDLDNNINNESGFKPSSPEDRGDFIEDEVMDVLDDDDTTNDSADSSDDDGASDNDSGDESQDENGDEANDEADDDNGEQESGDDSQSSEDESEEDADSDEKKKSKNKVPVSRLNKEIQKRTDAEIRIRELEAELAKKGQGEQTDDGDQEPKEKAPAISKEDFARMQDAMLDDKTDEAFDIFNEMLSKRDQALRDEVRSEVTGEVETEFEARAAVRELQNEAKVLGEKYPELDGNSDVADLGLIEEVIDLRDIYQQRGLAPAKALQKAVKMIASENELKDRTVKEEPKPKAKLEKKIDIAAKKEMADKEQGKLGGEGNKAADKEVSIADMSVDEFDKLSEEAKKRMRGDVL